MDRTIRLMRRTLLCAVFACPLAIFSLWLSFLCQFLFLLSAYWPVKADRPLWAGASPSFAKGVGRLLFAFSLSFAAAAALYRIGLLLAFPALPLRLMCALTALLIQGEVCLRVQKTGKRALAACLFLLLFTIVCMQ